MEFYRILGSEWPKEDHATHSPIGTLVNVCKLQNGSFFENLWIAFVPIRKRFGVDPRHFDPRDGFGRETFAQFPIVLVESRPRARIPNGQVIRQLDSMAEQLDLLFCSLKNMRARTAGCTSGRHQTDCKTYQTDSDYFHFSFPSIKPNPNQRRLTSIPMTLTKRRPSWRMESGFHSIAGFGAVGRHVDVGVGVLPDREGPARGVGEGEGGEFSVHAPSIADPARKVTPDFEAVSGGAAGPVPGLCPQRAQSIRGPTSVRRLPPRAARSTPPPGFAGSPLSEGAGRAADGARVKPR